MVDTWQNFNTWNHTKKILILMLAIVIFLAVDYFFFYPHIGAAWSIAAYFVYLIIVAILIRHWAHKESLTNKPKIGRVENALLRDN